jgi:hypothetical protein
MTQDTPSISSRENPQMNSTAVPYPPSYVDRMMNAVEGLRISYWIMYFLLFAMQVLVTHLVSWADGSITPIAFEPMYVLFPIWLWGPLLLITYLDKTARESLSSFRSLIDIESEKMARIEYQLTTMPGRNVIIGGVIWSGIYLIFMYSVFEAIVVEYGFSPLSQGIIFMTGLVSFFIGSTIYYHSIRQLRLVKQTVDMVERFDLFRLEPVYAFSRLTARTGASWLLLSTLTLIVFPIRYAVVPSIAMLLLQASLAVAAFVLPLWSVHQRLEGEKRSHLSELDQRVKSVFAKLHHSVDKGELNEIREINTALAGLAAEREVLDSIPTWPWRAQTLRGVLSLVVLPVVLLLIQLAIENWLIN